MRIKESISFTHKLPTKTNTNVSKHFTHQMESLISEKPVPFIEQYTDEHGVEKWRVADEAIELLEGIEDEVSAVGIIGKYRTGKSFVMNRLLEVEKGGFDLGHTTKGKTRGIWIWGKKMEDSTMLTLDTEGLYDVENDQDRDLNLFCLSILLTTVLVINFQGALDQSILDKLGFVTRLTELLHSEEDGEDFNSYFPNLIFLARDFALQIEGGDEQGYLNTALQNSKGKSPQITNLNNVKQLIKEIFPLMILRTLIMPVDDPAKNLSKMMDEPHLIKQEFIDKVDVVIQDIQGLNNVKRVQGVVLTGRGYARAASAFVDAINTNQKLSIPDAFESVCNVEKMKAIEFGITQYHSSWTEVREKFPISVEQFEKHHEDSKTTVLDQSLQYAKRIPNIHESIQQSLCEYILGKGTEKGFYHQLEQENNEKSIEFCSQKAQELYKEFQSKISDYKGKDASEEAHSDFKKIHDAYEQVAIGIGKEKAWDNIEKEYEKDLNLHLERLKIQEKEAELRLEKERAAEEKKQAELKMEEMREMQRQNEEKLKRQEEERIRQKEEQIRQKEEWIREKENWARQQEEVRQEEYRNKLMEMAKQINVKQEPIRKQYQSYNSDYEDEDDDDDSEAEWASSQRKLEEQRQLQAQRRMQEQQREYQRRLEEQRREEQEERERRENQRRLQEQREYQRRLEEEAEDDDRRFYKGGQFIPGGGRAPKGGLFVSSYGSVSQPQRQSSSGGCTCTEKFFKGGQFIPGGGRAPKGGVTKRVPGPGGCPYH